MPDTPIERAIKRRKELQTTIRDAMVELGEIAKFLNMYSQFSTGDELRGDVEEGSLSRAGVGMAQPVFEELVIMIMREVGRPMQSGEVVEEFRKRGHPIGGINETKAAWNRLWEAKTRKVLVHLPPLGYWLPDERIWGEVPDPGNVRKRVLRNPRRYLKGPRGAPRQLTPDKIKAAEEMLLAGKSVKEVATALGGLSPQTIYNNIPRSTRDILKKRMGQPLGKPLDLGEEEEESEG